MQSVVTSKNECFQKTANEINYNLFNSIFNNLR